MIRSCVRQLGLDDTTTTTIIIIIIVTGNISIYNHILPTTTTATNTIRSFSTENDVRWNIWCGRRIVPTPISTQQKVQEQQRQPQPYNNNSLMILEQYQQDEENYQALLPQIHLSNIII